MVALQAITIAGFNNAAGAGNYKFTIVIRYVITISNNKASG